MKIFIKIIPLILLLAICCKINYAQTTDSAKVKERIRIYEYFGKSILDNIKDTNAVYAFAFKAFVKKNEAGVAKVISLEANHTIAHKLFPDFEFLKTINYKLFMENQTQAEFVFPIIINIANLNLPGFPPKDDSLENIHCILHYKPGDGALSVENSIYFRPYIIKIDNTVRN